MSRPNSRTSFRIPPPLLALLLVVAVALGALGWWLAAPLFVDRTVNEAFLPAADAPMPEGMTRADAARLMELSARLDDPMTEPMPGGEDAATLLFDGELRDADAFHRGSGRIAVYRLADGSRVLRLEEIDVTNGPDLHVLVAAGAAPGNRADLDAAGYVDLGSLKGNRGSQTYAIPDEVPDDALGSVVIYCQPFHVLFSVGDLAAVTGSVSDRHAADGNRIRGRHEN